MELFPEEIPSDQRYFSPARLRAWGRAKLGERYTIAALAAVLGWSETMTRAVLRGNSSPGLEMYCRALARSGAPLGSWLQNCSREI